MHIIGIVGTAKNTGKTTTLAALIEEAGRRRERIGVTGIGYDGEEIDTVTGLPKPRLLLQPGTIVATSEQCLAHTTAGYTVVRTTDARTALGAVIIVEIVKPGMMVLAGPNTKRLLTTLTAEFASMGLGAAFVDGSLNRIAAMSVVDTMIFTTGASRAVDLSFLSQEARAICSLFTGGEYPIDPVPDQIELQDETGRCVARLPLRSLFDADDAYRTAEAMTERVTRIVIPKMASLHALEQLSARLAALGHKECRIIFGDPTISVLAGEPIAMQRWINASAANACTIGYRHAIRVAAMTVNPFYPRQHDHTYQPAYVDKDELLRSVRQAVNVPVYNIRDEHAPSALYDRCMHEH